MCRAFLVFYCLGTLCGSSALDQRVNAILDAKGNLHWHGKVFSVTPVDNESMASSRHPRQRQLADEMCTHYLGSRATSSPGATSVSDCFCQPGSFLKKRMNAEQCSACPQIGVECLGGFENSTGVVANASQKLHTAPAALKDYWMIDKTLGVATPCRLGGVCLGRNRCVEGHVGFACGNCEANWTRHSPWRRCRPCASIPGAAWLVLQVLFEWTVTLAWDFMLAFQFQFGTLIDLGPGARYDLVALVRLYCHWHLQIFALSQYNLTHERQRYSFTGGQEVAMVDWPHTYPDGNLWAPSIGSMYEVLECLVARGGLADADASYWKLMAPALYWLLYPIVLVLWMILLACVCVCLRLLCVRKVCKGNNTLGGSFTSIFAKVLPPWLAVTMSNAWFLVVRNLLPTMHCESYPLGKVRLMRQPGIQCYHDHVQRHLVVVGTLGLLLWGVGIAASIFGAIWRADARGTLQSYWFQRTFAFFLQGYGPRRSDRCWEVFVKRLDLFCLTLIENTSVADDIRTKVFLWTLQAALALALQLWCAPYHRSTDVLNRLENFGLVTRFFVFTAVSVWFQLELRQSTTDMLAVGVTALHFVFVCPLVLYAVDSWLAEQLRNLCRQIAIRKNLISMAAERRRSEPSQLLGVASEESVAGLSATENTKATDPRLRTLECLKRVIHRLQSWLCSEYRYRQLARVVWHGPTSDPQICIPTICESAIRDGSAAKMSKARLWCSRCILGCIKHWWGLNSNTQIECLLRCECDFAYIVLWKAKCAHLITRAKDAMMMLALGIKASRMHMIHNPCFNIEDGGRGHSTSAMECKPMSFLQCLKVMIMKEGLERIRGRMEERRKLVADIKPSLQSSLDSNVPVELAWQVLDRMSCCQVRGCLSDARPTLSKLRLVTHLLHCGDAEGDHEHDWERYRCILQQYEQEHQNGTIDVSPPACAQEEVTIEDLSHMLIFVQNVPLDELRDILLYTQAVVDFLALPSSFAFYQLLAPSGQVSTAISGEEETLTGTFASM